MTVKKKYNFIKYVLHVVIAVVGWSLESATLYKPVF